MYVRNNVDMVRCWSFSVDTASRAISLFNTRNSDVVGDNGSGKYAGATAINLPVILTAQNTAGVYRTQSPAIRQSPDLRHRRAQRGSAGDVM